MAVPSPIFGCMHMLIDGGWETRSATVTVFDPHDGAPVDDVPLADATDGERAVAAGRLGADQMRTLPTHERIRILRDAAERIDGDADAFTELLTLEGTKTVADARREVLRCSELLRLSAEEARRVVGETVRFDQAPRGAGRVGYFDRVPAGLTIAVIPFNDALALAGHKAGPAIAAGVPLVIKPSLLAPLSVLRFAEVMLASGLPSHGLQVLTGDVEVSQALVTHDNTRVVWFTGGTATGEVIARAAGLKRMVMELGANSPVIVCADADLELAVAAVASGAFANAGQNCLGVQRVYVERELLEAFISALVTATSKIVMGDKRAAGTDMGPMITEEAARRIESWVDEAVAGGAQVQCGGHRSGAYYAPTVLTNVPADAKVVREEVFGPVVSVFGVDSLDDAIRAANDVPHGLHAGIFTKGLDSAFRAVQELHVGAVAVNDSSDFRIDTTPFGGVKRSGLGREGIRWAVEELTETKVVSLRLGS
jgi:glyceraldehyde-3-phosphate dehydrogenase (NADP+)